MRDRLHLLVLVGLFVLFLDKPVHVDDANFLAMARTAAETPWTPHGFSINWGGTTESAFNVLSNPPGIAWWLAPVSNGPIALMHAWMLPWLILAGVGAYRLGERIAGKGQVASLLICGAPVAMLASHSLTPDLPLLACTLWGVDALLDEKRRERGALVMGAAACFRYSGLALLPLVVVWPWMQGERSRAMRLGAIAAIPIVALMIHDAAAYGSIHLLAMTEFQSVSNGADDLIHKSIASVATFGAAAVLPIVAWCRPRRAIVGAAIGLLIGVGGAQWAAQAGTAQMATVLSCTAGGASIGGALSIRDPLDRWLLLWLLGGLAFLLGLRFTATRYWIPFYAPAILIGLRHAPTALARSAAFTTIVLSLILAADDVDFATTQAEAAQIAGATGTGSIAGHWGFQHYLHERGWTDIEDDQRLEPGTWIAESRAAWPQEPANECFDFTDTVRLVDPRPGLRVHTVEGGANFHGHTLAGKPPIKVFAPWSIGTDPMDELTLRRVCQ